ncbi:hypothetical protein BR63_00675 [Thermanaerosceptrum fracticalcis]|uniref:DUF5320 domain-containing protein n=1 Tax=Thermanaerosceptrum fracticalcis TaxID=1712410 RepID=A0A7G6DYR3_THEFR|nr:DUF5320 domain-containing protein [Thermanaerosceptrum fracticalcis]QNB44967.1 hypothetical protein BR63_00675 [Thermanaerosceptrum fracticalcis]
MPGFNGRGPSNRGPMTGWGRGYCITEVTPEKEAAWAGLGFGLGLGLGRGLGRRLGRRFSGALGRGLRCWGLRGALQPDLDQSFLKERATYLKEELNRIEALLKQEKESNDENK